jgi:hypothetical protein
MPDFEASAFDDKGEVEFSSIPAGVEQLLKPDLDKTVLNPDEQNTIQQMMSGQSAMKVDWADLAKRDPVATIVDPLLTKIGKTVSVDVALAVPDLAMMILSAPEGNSVRSNFQRMCGVMNLDTADGAVIGRIPISDRFASSQVKRKVLESFVAKVRAAGIANVHSLSEYVNGQRPSASASWVDAMLLVTSGIVLDDAYLGDYPYNLRLYTKLTQGDWTLLESGLSFAASQLSRPAQEQLYDVLVQARSRLARETPDPGLWKTLAFSDLQIRTVVKQEQVLIGFTSVAAEVRSVSDSASMYEMRLKALKREPLYQPASRRRFELTISSALDEESVQTGFSEVTPTANVKASSWDKLPPAMAAEFKKVLESEKRSEGIGGVPPP